MNINILTSALYFTFSFIYMFHFFILFLCFLEKFLKVVSIFFNWLRHIFWSRIWSSWWKFHMSLKNVCSAVVGWNSIYMPINLIDRIVQDNLLTLYSYLFLASLHLNSFFFFLGVALEFTICIYPWIEFRLCQKNLTILQKCLNQPHWKGLKQKLLSDFGNE